MTGRYRCREHVDQAVTWRGTGCGLCDREAAKPDRRRSRAEPPGGERGDL